jgi:hypothetical protein
MLFNELKVGFEQGWAAVALSQRREAAKLL